MAVRHYETGNVLWLVFILWSLLIPSLFLFTGFSAQLRDFVHRPGRKWFAALCFYFILWTILNYALDWPLAYYAEFVRPHGYGLSDQAFAKWFGDSLKELVLTLATGMAFLWLPYWLIRKCPQRWWLYGGLAMLPVYLFLQFVQPVIIAPMFNDFTPIHDKNLESKILALAERAGIQGSRVYEVNKSVDTKTVNAYVTGFMGSKRIVLWDTILKKLNERELLFVMGHEMGHYVLGHVIREILFEWLLTIVAFYGVHRASIWMLRRFGARFRFSELADMASLPLLALLIHVFTLLLEPVDFAYSRHLEHQADRFGLELTHYNHSAATGFVKLLNENLGVPRPGRWFVILRATHPSIGDRMDFFNSYKPWEKEIKN